MARHAIRRTDLLHDRNLAVRRDLLQEAALPFPTTFEQVLSVGRALHAPAHGRYGITWNAARGMPIAASFLFLLGDCGSFLLERSAACAKGQTRPVIDMAAELRVLDYMDRLLEISPPGVTEFDWETSLDTFLTGHAAMTYCWSMRAARFEYDTRSKVSRKVEYLPHPAGPHGRVTAPIGGFVLCVPANLPEERMQLAVDAIAWITSPDTVRDHLKRGLPVRPRFSVISDPEVMRSSPIVNFVERVARRDLLDSWQRPPIPEYVAVENVLGDEVHDALTGRTSGSGRGARADRCALSAQGSRGRLSIGRVLCGRDAKIGKRTDGTGQSSAGRPGLVGAEDRRHAERQCHGPGCSRLRSTLRRRRASVPSTTSRWATA